MVKIPKDLLKEILYFVNDWIRLTGFGREHARLARLVWGLYKAGSLPVNLTGFYYINQVIQNFERIERIENEKA